MKNFLLPKSTGAALPLLLCLFGAAFLGGSQSWAQALPPGEAPAVIPTGPIVEDIVVRGNAKVESDAIIALLKSRRASR